MSRRRLPKVVAKATEWARAQLIGPGNAGVCEWAPIESGDAFKMAVKRTTLKAECSLAGPPRPGCWVAGGWWVGRQLEGAGWPCKWRELGARSWEQEQPAARSQD
uniref:HDC08264 n=1 Tax=Drosophila melanogaster TaxID=7227 RepID=Q6ILV9_DROME|nr:TPA_inf: HDC08264 [Drosophila melanogaster]